MQRERRLEPADEANLVLDHPGQVNVFLVAGLLTRGGFVGGDGVLDMTAVRGTIARRVQELPTLRQLPVRAGRHHAWGEREPDLEAHVRLIPPLGSREDLERRCGDLMIEPLPLTRPLWELLVAPAPGGAGMILRIHHALADGMAAADLIRSLLGDSAGPAQPTMPRSSPPGSHREAARLGRAISGARRTLTTLVARGLPETILLGERSSRHGVVFADADLDRIKEAAHRVRATVNDAVLAVAAAAYRTALAQGPRPVPSEVPVSVPVALPRRGDSRNQVGVMLVRLPVAAGAPEHVVAAIAAQTREKKVEARGQGTLELMRGPVGARIIDRIARRQHLVGGFVTNVPGPAHELRLAGAPLAQLWPVAVLAANVRLGVAAVSYAGQLCVSVHYDADCIDGKPVAAAVRRELAALAASVPER